MVTPKYRGTPLDPLDGRPLYWSAHPDGLPIREGDSPTLIDEQQLAHAGTNLYFQSQVLRIPEDIGRYKEVMDWVANGLAVLHSEKVTEVPGEPGKWVVWLSWAHVRGYIPKTVPRNRM